MNIKPQRIIVGLSGGVDSAVAAYLLKKAGHEVVGVFMKNWEDDDDTEYCSSREDFVSAAACAEVIGIEINHVNFSKEYKDRVFSYFLKELQKGRTPNPDILCNSEIKFQAFLHYATELSADAVATGHYAKKVVNSDNAPATHHLCMAADGNKDQSYFLYRLAEKQLMMAIFPLADIPKPEVRKMAKEAGIPSAERKDSTGICFIGERPFRDFLSRYLPTQEGDIVTEDGKVIGRHMGLAFYTLGQRKGLHIGGVKGADESPWFVCHKDLVNNRLVVVQGHLHPALYSREVCAEQLHWLSPVNGKAPLQIGDKITAKVRYRQKDAPCVVTELDEIAGTLTVQFTHPQWAVTSGQSLVLYRKADFGTECLGGGIIA